MEEQKSIRFEAEPKPEINDVRKITPNTEEFEEPEKAEALIKNLNLSVGDTIKENGEYYEINPKMVLEGDSPKHYKDTIENLKKVLTKQEIKLISNYLRRKKEDQEARDKIYYSIQKRTDKFYWRGNIKKSLSEDLKEVLEFFKNNNHMGIGNTTYHLLSKESYDYTECYKLAWLNKPIPNIQTWNEKNDGEYRVLTDSEADYQAREYLEDDDYLWKQSVEAGNTTSGFNDWIDEVLNMDGRASLLNGYDGSEEYEEVNGTDYYIYRNN